MAKEVKARRKPIGPRTVLQCRLGEKSYEHLASCGRKRGLTIAKEAERRLAIYEKHEKAIERLQNEGNPKMSLGIPRKILEGFMRAGAEHIAVRAAEIAIQRIISETKVHETA